MKTFRKRMHGKEGFTLIELMIVVAIIGILAAVAIPSFLKFIRKSKTTEALINVKALNDGGIAWYGASHPDLNGDPLVRHFPNSGSPHTIAVPSSTTVPASAPCSGGTPQYKLNSTQWESYPWKALKFGIEKAHYFQYQYATNGTGTNSVYTITARANLDCDSILSTYTLRGAPNSQTGEVEYTSMIITEALE